MGNRNKDGSVIASCMILLVLLSSVLVFIIAGNPRTIQVETPEQATDTVMEASCVELAHIKVSYVELTSEETQETTTEFITETEPETTIVETSGIDMYDAEQLQKERDDSMIRLLAALIRAEAGNQPYDGKRLVADVVLNRVASSEFPGTINDVIFQPGQFAVVANGALNEAWNTMDESDLAAARQEYYGPRLDAGVLYFATYKANGVGFYKVGDHWFSY